jgi:hypothetical protein
MAETNSSIEVPNSGGKSEMGCGGRNVCFWR